MPDAVHLIPLTAIDDAAIPRDRTALDPEPLRELRDSIRASGLRMPVELFPLADPAEPLRYGIVSGFRRIAAFRELHGAWGLEAYAAIPAFLRPAAGFAETLALMVEENAVRDDLSPWEQGRIAVLARDQGAFPTIEAAVDRLYPTANAMKRSRLRSIARLVELLEGLLTDPEKLSARQALRIATAIRQGFGEVIETALQQSSLRDPASQWSAILPYLVESERFSTADPEPDTPANPRETRGRPRRVLRPRPHLVIRRELARDGYILRFTGREATSGLLDEVLDEIERLYSPG